MTDDTFGLIERRPTTVDLSWFLDLEKNGQLDLDPAYQRRSVWTPSDRRYFLDSIFRNYPSPAIFLHKSINDAGDVKYHVVDGKQRITTILQFAANKIALGNDFGDDRLNGKKWRDIDPTIRRRFWNYPIPIEQIDALQGPLIKDVFARLNKNSRKLTRQELRHARFDGWFITFVEREVLDQFWKDVKVRTTAKEKRMMDVQNLSELCQVIIDGDVSGFDQFTIDELYAELEEADSEESGFDVEGFVSRFQGVKDVLAALESFDSVVSSSAQPFIHLYSLWSYLVTESVDLETAEEVAPKYKKFMEDVAAFELGKDFVAEAPDFDPDEHEETRDTTDGDHSRDNEIESLVQNQFSPDVRDVARYKLASVGATTEPPQRRARLISLRSVLSE